MQVRWEATGRDLSEAETCARSSKDRALASGARGCAFESRRAYWVKGKQERMRKSLADIARFGVILLLGAFAVPGCRGDRIQAYSGYELGPARETVAASVETMGGLARWKRVGKIRADALVTIYDEQGQAHVNRQRHVIDIHGGVITATARTARGRWKATLRRGGRFTLRRAAALDRITPAQLREVLTILLHRVGGPLNLLGKTERVKSAEDIYLGGRSLVRVAVTGGAAMASAYYFETPGGLLHMVTAGADTPTRKGTVTLYDYQMLPNGLIFPKKIRVFQTGQHVLIGRMPVMEVEYCDVRIP